MWKSRLVLIPSGGSAEGWLVLKLFPSAAAVTQTAVLLDLRACAMLACVCLSIDYCTLVFVRHDLIDFSLVQVDRLLDLYFDTGLLSLYCNAGLLDCYFGTGLLDLELAMRLLLLSRGICGAGVMLSICSLVKTREAIHSVRNANAENTGNKRFNGSS